MDDFEVLGVFVDVWHERRLNYGGEPPQNWQRDLRTQVRDQKNVVMGHGGWYRRRWGCATMGCFISVHGKHRRPHD
ncbi:hypothetical protein Moror_8672 [Moniliophthora roreri MCA 2997]|uniref:Uncharacterized protein n=1 Tax=Moniliophthora roreri (strain MCA 2997) TaxID=1381753 RepID=V2X9X3_MONRO|nr:hypothetical protein Moror_8672 [Moniliophthora roreri MCA 2997]KAI3611510.1 hypothetical protein WG66_002230 [Moniliophthora roreri]